jgi:hypothetical protein
MDNSQALQHLNAGTHVLVKKEELQQVLEQNKEMKVDLKNTIDFIANLFSYFFSKDAEGKPTLNVSKLTPLISQILMPKLSFGKQKETDIKDHAIYKALKIEAIAPTFEKYAREYQNETQS